MHERQECFILTELGTVGSLSTLLYGDKKRKFYLDLRVKCRILRDIVRGMKFLHDDVNVVHRDLKPSNIIIDSNYRARIGDFNLSSLVGNTSNNPTVALISKNKTEGRTSDQLDLKMCDVYSFGILANEVFTEKKPFEGLTDENFFQKIVIDKEKPQLPKKKENHPFVILVKSCWDDDPGKQTTFSKLLEPKNGLIQKIKEVPPPGATYSEKLREKLKKKWKEGGNEAIQFKEFWEKFESAFVKENADKALSFIKILLNITEQQQKVFQKDAERICDWLSGAEVRWIANGFRTSTFFKHFVGVFTKEEIEKKYGIMDKNLKCAAILHWDPVKDLFCLSVRRQKGNEITWEQHYLKTKQIGAPLKKEVDKEIKTQRYKEVIPKLYQTTLFERLKKGDNTPQVYTVAESASIAPIYVN